MMGETKKILKKLVCAGILAFALAGTSEARAELIFENIPVTTAPGPQMNPAVWGNYIVWRGAVNEVYDISQEEIIEMPGLSIGNRPATHNNKIVWSDSTGYYDLDLGQMIHPPGLSIGYEPDIFGDKIIWSYSTGYYDIDLQRMVYPEGLSIGKRPAIHDNIIVWERSTGYYDIDLQRMVYPEGLSIVYNVDIFEESIVWDLGVGGGEPRPPANIFIWDPIDGTRIINESGKAFTPKIYNNVVVWESWDGRDYILMRKLNKNILEITTGNYYVANPDIYNNFVVWQDFRDGNWDIYMAIIGTLEGDINKDGIVNMLDLTEVCEYWLKQGLDISADVNRDEIVNLLDYSIIINDWMQQEEWYQP